LASDGKKRRFAAVNKSARKADKSADLKLAKTSAVAETIAPGSHPPSYQLAPNPYITHYA
jgi:hypothetical protein